MNGSFLSIYRTIGWIKVRGNQNNNKKIELNNRTGIFFTLHTALQWIFFFLIEFYRKEEIEPI